MYKVTYDKQVSDIRLTLTVETDQGQDEAIECLRKLILMEDNLPPYHPPPPDKVQLDVPTGTPRPATLQDVASRMPVSG